MHEERGKRAKLMSTLQSDQEIVAVIIEKIGAAFTELTYDDDNRLIKLGLSGLALTQLPPEATQARGIINTFQPAKSKSPLPSCEYNLHQNVNVKYGMIETYQSLPYQTY